MQIRQVADLLGVSSRTIRFYEEKGLIQPQKYQKKLPNNRDALR